MNKLFSFGEKIPDYDMKVLNEREVRASAGILFLFAMIAFLNSWLMGDFTITKIFVVVFLVEFSIRVLINPKYAPLLVISRFFVRNQEVEYVGAPQKRFAWIIGLVLAVIMFYLIVINNVIGPVNLLVCIICLALLFFEAAFGICLACKVYNLFHQQKAELCPGNACAVKDRVEIQTFNLAQLALVPLFLGLIYTVANSSLIHAATDKDSKVAAGDCEIPGWVKKIGHEEKWKLHNGCVDDATKPKQEMADKDHDLPQSPAIAHDTKPKKDCTVPQFAIDMGHEEKWKEHNGCADDAQEAQQIAMPKAPQNQTISDDKKPKKDCVVPQFALDMGHEKQWKLHNGC